MSKKKDYSANSIRRGNLATKDVTTKNNINLAPLLIAPLAASYTNPYVNLYVNLRVFVLLARARDLEAIL